MTYRPYSTANMNMLLFGLHAYHVALTGMAGVAVNEIHEYG